MKDFIEQSKSLLTATKENWKDREAFLNKLTKYVKDTQDPDMLKYLQKCYKHIAIQLQDLRYK
jgi:DNA-binding transcriptional regulator GbsR (MarR family)